MRDLSPPSPVLVLTPVFNDWAVLADLICQLDSTFAPQGLPVELLVVDDGSQEPVPDSILTIPPKSFVRIDVLELRRNVGHQRAICIGLAHIAQHRRPRAVVVMDADGEDSATDVLKLLSTFDEFQGRYTVFAARTKRAEGTVFKVGYFLFRSMHRLLVGFGVRVGNFSVLPAHLLDGLVLFPELWNHYAATVFKSRTAIRTVPVARAKRLGGESRMGLVNLVVHGMSAMSVYSDILGVRLIFASVALAVLVIVAGVLTVIAHLSAAQEFPGWAASAATLALAALIQGFMLTLIFTFIVVYGRSGSSFIPARDCPQFVRCVRNLYQRA